MVLNKVYLIDYVLLGKQRGTVDFFRPTCSTSTILLRLCFWRIIILSNFLETFPKKLFRADIHCLQYPK